MKITHLLETRLHADHVSGNPELAARTGAAVYRHAGALADFAHTADRLQLGSVWLEVLDTPGHTPESHTQRVTGATRAPEPWVALTGDTLFVGDVGRPDLVGADAARQSAGQMYDSLFDGLLKQSDSLLMLRVSGLMFFGAKRPSSRAPTPRGWPITLAAGAVAGLLTGLLRVGGGFLIVPALVMLVGLPMKEAVGTALLIIAPNSLAGLLGHLQGEPPDLILQATFAATGLVGIVLGTRLAHRLPADQLRRSFAILVVLLAGVRLVDSLPKPLN